MKKLTIVLLLPLLSIGQIPKGYVPGDSGGRLTSDSTFSFDGQMPDKKPVAKISIKNAECPISFAPVKIDYPLKFTSGSIGDESIPGNIESGEILSYTEDGIRRALVILSDSLWTETPAIKDASTAAVTVGEEFTTSAGRLKAIKFWKNETAGNYVITLWHPNGASLFSQQYKSTTTGWQKITMDLPLEAGTYVIGVYFPNGKYVYTNGLNPRTRTSLTGNKGLFSGGNSKPGGSYTASFFVDAVIEYGTTVPLTVKTSPDRDATMYKDSVGVSAVATGYTKFQWTVEDFEGRFTLKDTNTLKPYVIPLDSSGCRVWLFCTVTDASGNQMADAVAIRVAPHPKMVMGYYLWNGTFVWRVPPTFIELPTPATYVRP